MDTVGETSSLGFDVRLCVDMTSSEGDNIGSVLSGSSEGFQSAQATPTLSMRQGYDGGEHRSLSAVSADSASFHTPEPYDMSSHDEEDIDLSSVEIPDFEAPPTSSYGIEKITHTNVSMPELPKLALAEGVRGGVAEKGPMGREYTGMDHRESRQLASNGTTNERTPLIHSNTDIEDKGCCILL